MSNKRVSYYKGRYILDDAGDTVAVYEVHGVGEMYFIMKKACTKCDCYEKVYTKEEIDGK